MKFYIEKDKQYHLIAGFLITLIFGLILDIRAGVFIGVLAGVVKETLDYFDYGVFDKRDAFFTAVGSIIAGLILVVFT